MKVFTCTNFHGHWPVGVSAVIVAEDYEQAERLLSQKLLEAGLASYQTTPFSLQEVVLDFPSCAILQDGNY